jgi:oxygen-independent coproporphyrinogen-3 oxidase
VQPLEVVEGAVNALRSANLDAINMDVMYGLPQQSLEDVVRSVAACAAMNADRIALFGYAHVPWMKKNQTLIDEEQLPSAGARLEQVRAAHKALEHLGYVSIGFDHFAKPDDSMAKAMRGGTLRRNFQGYTTDTATTLIGFGASSIGKLRQGYVQTAADIGAWTRGVEAGELPVARGYALTAEDRLRGAIIEALLTSFDVDLAAPQFGVVPGQTWVNEQLIGLDDLVEDGLCEVMGTKVRIPHDARFLARLVASRFDGFMDRSQARHSVAV